MANEQSVPRFKYPENVGQKPYDKWILFEAKAGRRIGRTTRIPDAELADNTLACAALYLPESALDSGLSVQWSDTKPMGTLMGTLAQKFAKEGSALFNTSMSDWDLGKVLGAARLGGQNTLDKVRNGELWEAAKDFGEASLFQHLQGMNIPGLGDLSEVLPLATGMQVNPRTAAFFTSVEFREYQMDFRMVPRNPYEARQIDEIVHFFQFYMLPAYYGNANDNGQVDPAMIGFPYEFDVSLHATDDEQMGHVNKFERSVITGFTVDHSPQEKVMFVENGRELYPVATDINIKLREIVLLDRNSDQIKRDGVTDLRDPRYVRNR